MKKKELKQRIKELEAENLLLRTMAMQPIYIYLYRQLPYNPWWEYFPPRPYISPQPTWIKPHDQYWGVSGTRTQPYDGSWQITGSQTYCNDYPIETATLSVEPGNYISETINQAGL